MTDDYRDDRRRVPSIGEIRELSYSVRASAERVHIEYQWLYRAAYERSVVEEVKVRAGGADPVGSLIGARGKGRARSACTDASERLRDAMSALMHAEKLLLAALDRQDPVERIEPTRYPRTATREDLRLAAEAAERRQARGDHIP